MAKVIRGNDPDVQALQEVESLEALRQFNRKYLKHAYPYAFVIDAHDPWQSDVGLLSKFDGVPALPYQNGPEGSPVTLLINHPRPQIYGGAAKRKRQTERVRDIPSA